MTGALLLYALLSGQCFAANRRPAQAPPSRSSSAPSARAVLQPSLNSNIDQWAQKILLTAQKNPIFQANVRSGRVLALRAEAAGSLANWKLTSTDSYSITNGVANGAANRALAAQIGLSRYVGTGVDLSAGVSDSRTQYKGYSTTSATGGFSFEVAVDLWRNFGGSYEAMSRRANVLSVQAETVDLHKDRESITRQVLESSLQICAQRAQVQSIAQIGKTARQFSERVKAQGRAGIAGASDLIQFELLLMGIDRTRIELERQRDSQVQGLKALFGVDLNMDECPEFTMPRDIKSRALRTPTESELNNAPEMVSGRLRVQQKELERDVRRRGLVPVLQPFASVNTANSTKWTDVQQYSVGVRFEWVIPGSRETNEARAAIAQALAQSTSLAAQNDRLIGQWLDIDRDRQLAIDLHAISLEQLKASRQLVEIEDARYQIGKSTALSMTQAYRSYLDAAAALPPLVAQYYRADWQGLAFQGKLKESLVK